MSALRVGDRVKFDGERQRYTVRGVTSDGRYAVCTKPFNARNTTLYTIIDFERGVRGRDNYYGLGYETDRECRRATLMLGLGMAEVSYRHWVPLDIERVDAA